MTTSRLEYGTTTNYGSQATLDVSGLLVHTATILGLSAGTTYHYCIHATDLAGNVANACHHTFATAHAAIVVNTNPPTISLVTVAPVTSTTATIAWTTDEVANGDVQYGLTPSYGSTTAFDANLSITHTRTISSLSPNTLYHYRIRSSDEVGNVAVSNDNTFTTEQNASSAPSVIITIPETTSSSASATTTTSTGATTSVTTPQTSVSTVPSSSSTSSTAGSVTVIVPETRTTTTVTTPLGSTTISTHSLIISGIETGAVTSTAVAIEWTTTLPSDSQLEYGVSSLLGHTTSLDETLTTAHAVTLSGLTPNTNYYFRVRSKPAGVGAFATISTLHDFNTLAEATPTVPPAHITAVSAEATGLSQASIAVTTDKATSVHVEYGITTGYGQTTELTSARETSHTLTLSDLTADTTYHYRVKAIDSVGNITYSQDHSFATPAATLSLPTTTTTPNTSGAASTIGTNTSATTTAPAIQTAPPPPSVIGTLAVHSSDATSATLTWSASSASADAAAEYDIRYSTNPITETNFASALQDQATLVTYDELSAHGTTRSYIVAGLTPGTTYYFALRSKFEHSDFSTISNVPSATLPAATSSTSEANGAQPAANAGVAQQDSSSAASSTPVENTPTASRNGNAGGGGGGATAQSVTGPIEAPIVLNATGTDGQVLLRWKNPNESSFVRTVVVRKANGYPTSPTDGEIIYEGNGETFTDTNLVNGTTYYYSVSSYDHRKHYSKAIHVSLSPKQSNIEVLLDKAPEEEPILATDHFVEVMKRGLKDIEVEHLQEILARDEHLYPERLITGYFGSLTESALKRFQQKHRLPQTGITDKATQAKLNIVSQSTVKLSTAEDLALFEHDLKPGSQGEDVENLQIFLIYEGSYAEAIITGHYDDNTANAVKAFQKKYGVHPVSGYFGYKTRHRILEISGL